MQNCDFSEYTVAKAENPLGSSVNVSVEKRSGSASIVYFTRDLSPSGLEKIYQKVKTNINGRVGIKLHTGEKNGPNIVPAFWIKQLIEKQIPTAHIVETNTYYEGDRYTTKQHRETLKINGWTFAPVDILDEDGTMRLPVIGGKHFKDISVGNHIVNYDSLLVLTHFKGHTMGGFGGSNKNIGIGMADGRIGKAQIHTYPGQGQWSIDKEEFMERMTESAKATVDYFGKNITFINVLRNMSVSCDCEGIHAEPVVTPDIGILASDDILAVDQASVDMVYQLNHKSAELRQRIETRHGLRQLSYMKELSMGNDKYVLIDLDKEATNE